MPSKWKGEPRVNAEVVAPHRSPQTLHLCLGAHVRHSHTDEERWAIGFTGHVHETGMCLRHEVERWLGREGSALSEAGDRGHDETGSLFNHVVDNGTSGT